MFLQHGFKILNENETQFHGTCPFCEKHKFFINKTTFQWDCKVCAEYGNSKSFLTKISANNVQNITDKEYKLLSEKKHLKIETLKSAEIGYNFITKEYTLPVYDFSNKLVDLRIYNINKNSLMSTKGCRVFIYGAPDIEKSKHIWLGEGGWDWLVLREIVPEGHIALAVPAATTFKAEWASLFEEKNLKVIFDNDEDRVVNNKTIMGAGPSGMIKIYNTLRSVCTDIQFIHWPEGLKSGYDIRDLYVDNKHNGVKTINDMTMLFQEFPMKMKTANVKSNANDDIKGIGIDADEVRSVYRKWLYLPDEDIIDALYGAVISNRMQGDPIWLMIVAPSGGAKTELLLSLDECPRIYKVSTLTSKSLVSGFNVAGGFDPSLIPKLNNKMLIVKDLTPLLTTDQGERSSVFGYLRDAYDGSIQKQFGHVYRSYKSTFGLVAGVTEVIEAYTEEMASLGERFLRYWLHIDTSLKGRLEYNKRAQQNAKHKDQMRKELSTVAKKCLTHNFDDDIDIPNDILNMILHLAEYVARMRGTVRREKYTNEITHKPFIELSTRLTTQLTKYLIGICQFRRIKTATIAEYEIIKKISASSTSGRYADIIRKVYLLGKENEYSINDLVGFTKLSTIMTTRLTENLCMLGVLRKPRTSRLSNSYKLTDDMIQIIETTGVFTNAKGNVRASKRATKKVRNAQ